MKGQNLEPVSKLHSNPQLLAMHKTHNPMFAPSFMQTFTIGIERITIDKLIEIAADQKEEWLTDLICPSVENLIKIEFAAKFISEYKIRTEDIEQLYNEFKGTKEYIELYTEVEETISTLRNKHFEESTANETIVAALKEFKKISFAACEAIINKDIDKILMAIPLENRPPLKYIPPRKTTSERSADNAFQENRDLCLLGGAASGKSTLVSSLMAKSDIDVSKEDYCILCTDDYREITFFSSDYQYDPKFGFITTQDTSYLIKERVQNRIKKLDDCSQRPNVIMDGITFENHWRELFFSSESTNTVDVRIVCLEKSEEAIQRAWNRAKTAKSYADNRTVLPSALLEGHRRTAYSIDQRFLEMFKPEELAKDHMITFNDTSGTSTSRIATLSVKNRAYQVFDLRGFLNYKAKYLINVDAKSRIGLYINSDDNYTYTTRNIAQSFLIETQRIADQSGTITCKLSTPSSTSQNHLINPGYVYAQIQFEQKGKPKIVVHNLNVFKEAMLQDLKETKLSGHIKHNVLHALISEMYLTTSNKPNVRSDPEKQILADAFKNIIEFPADTSTSDVKQLFDDIVGPNNISFESYTPNSPSLK